MALDGNRRWVERLPLLLSDFNAERVKGTRYRRNRVTAANFEDFIKEKFGVDDWSTVVNSHKIDGRHLTASFPKIAERIFKYKEGDSVLVERRADPRTPLTNNAGSSGDNFNVFTKPSQRGYYGGTRYHIHARRLTTDKTFILFPVYKLCPDHGVRGEKHSVLRGHFYQFQLTKVV